MRILAVRIGDDEPEVAMRQRPEHRHVRDPCREGAADPQDLVEHHVRDLMAREPQARAVRADLVAEQALTGENVVELEIDGVAVRPLGLHLADQDVVVAEPTPIIEADARAGVRLFHHILAIHGLEAPAPREIAPDDRRRVERAIRGVRRQERHHGDRDGVVLAAGYFHDEFRAAAL